jgi:hypothetical protein
MTSPLPTADEVLAQAQERTGLREIDSDSWREGLEVLLADAANPLVHAGGHKMILDRAVDSLANRLRVHAYIQEHPEVLEERIERPLFIMGMPRTGTTAASYMLDQDPARRSLLNWEAMNSAPPATTETLRTDPRCLAVKEEQEQMLDLIKTMGMAVPHWEDADGPTECMFVLGQDFKGLMWDSFTATSDYADWLLGLPDVDSAYEYEKRVLQVLQSKAPGTWSLKMPSHTVHIESLLKVFPDARLVWAHRDPYKATASHCNLLALPAAMCVYPVDKEAIGRFSKRQMREHVMRPLAVRERIGEDRIFDLHYAELMRDPMAAMRSLYEWAGDEFTPEVEQAMLGWLRENPQHKLGVAKYTLAEYGLSKEELEPVFAEYLDTFDIELEGEA